MSRNELIEVHASEPGGTGGWCYFFLSIFEFMFVYLAPPFEGSSSSRAAGQIVTDNRQRERAPRGKGGKRERQRRQKWKRLVEYQATTQRH